MPTVTNILSDGRGDFAEHLSSSSVVLLLMLRVAPSKLSVLTLKSS